jgi:hypothetical protein
MLVLPRGGGLPDVVVADYIYALQLRHLMDVVSTDQYTAKQRCSWRQHVVRRFACTTMYSSMRLSALPIQSGRATSPAWSDGIEVPY